MLSDTSYVISYTPYTSPTGAQIITNVMDMIDYDVVVPNTPVSFTYEIGSTSMYSEEFTIRNITTNATLTVATSLVGQPTMWTIEGPTQFQLLPSQEYKVRLVLNTSAASLLTDRQQLNTSLVLTITSPALDGPIFKNTQLPVVTKRRVQTV